LVPQLVDVAHFGHRTLPIPIYGHQIRVSVHLRSLDAGTATYLPMWQCADQSPAVCFCKKAPTKSARAGPTCHSPIPLFFSMCSPFSSSLPPTVNISSKGGHEGEADVATSRGEVRTPSTERMALESGGAPGRLLHQLRPPEGELLLLDRVRMEG
jgi:hypothetical protein